ncbi:MAG: rhodanese-like domain-containing protein [Clostridia bacterium]|nr:rhodanese-like domain-containing protein [Clostridia bacterium]
MKHRMGPAVLVILLLLCLTGCGGNQNMANGYQQITPKEAKEMMNAQDVLILDVREQYEYDSGYISGAVLLPVGTITVESASAVIPAKDTVVLVYCRSGNRSKKASAKLAELGYTNIYEFGGINTWPYGITTE